MNTPPTHRPPEPGFEGNSHDIPAHVKEDLELPMEELLHRIYRESLYIKQGDGGRISKTIAKACTLLTRVSKEQDRVAKANLVMADKLLIIGWITLAVAVVTAVITLIDVFKK